MASTLEVALGGRRALAHVETLACACQKVGRSHEHHFVASDLLKTLPAGTRVELRLEELSGEAEGRTRLAVVPIE